MRMLTLLALCIAAPALAQDLPHPDDLDLPESRYERPDPGQYRLTLDNGLVAYVAESGHVPLVTLSAFVRVGSSDGPEGAAEALKAVLTSSGPSGISATEFASRLEQMAAVLTVDVHPEWTEISINAPSEDLDVALELFAGLLLDPAIDRDGIAIAATSADAAGPDLGGESGAALYAGSMDVAVGHFYDTIYSRHPYGDAPDADDFDDLTPKALKRFHAAYFVPGNTTLAVAGDIDADAIKARLTALLSDWEAADIPAVPTMPAVKRADAALYHYPANKLQSWLVIGHDLPRVPEEDRAALDVMTYILGAYHLNTRLMRETRYKYGYTNDASAFLEERWFGPGGYTFRSYSRPEVIENIYRNMMREINRIREEVVGDRELSVAKGALADGIFQEHYEDGYALTRNLALEKLRYGDHDRSASYVERVRKVSKADVLKAAQAYLDPDHMQVILVGEAAFEL